MIFLLINLLWAVLVVYFLLDRLFSPALVVGFAVIALLFSETDIVFEYLGMEQFILLNKLLDLLLVVGVLIGFFMLRRRFRQKDEEQPKVSVHAP